MKIDGQAILNDLKAKQLPVLEKDLVVAIDSVVTSLQGQAQAQVPDIVASVLAIGLAEVKPILDKELAVLLPDSAK